MPTTWNAIFLGNSATALDPTEGDAHSENSGSFLGTTFGSDTNRLSKQVVSVQATNVGGSGTSLDTNNFDANDTVTYDIGAGSQTQIFDGIVVYNALLTYVDGLSASITAVVFQDDAGNLFLAPEFSNNSDVTAMEAKPIRSLTLNSVSVDSTNLTANRYLTNFLCFGEGTRILTPEGPIPIERLKPGRLVLTRDNGPKRIRWIRSSQWKAMAKRSPIRFGIGSLGGGLPERPLIVSRQHRMLVASKIAKRIFGTSEVILPAVRFLPLPNVETISNGRLMTFWHMALDRHEIIYAEGAPAETLLPGRFALRSMRPNTRNELLRLFPTLAKSDGRIASVRPVPVAADQRELIERHVRNCQPVLGPDFFETAKA